MDGGAGPLSSRLTTWTWRGVRAVAGRHDHGAPSLFGPIVLVGIVLTWVVLLRAGWVFVFAMGNGDVTPNGEALERVASVTNASGMLLVTLVITYVLSVIGAVVQKRAFASLVTNLGMNEEAVLKDVRGGGDLRTLDLPRDGIAPQPSLLSAQYEAYPVLQSYPCRPTADVADRRSRRPRRDAHGPTLRRPGRRQAESRRAAVRALDGDQRPRHDAVRLHSPRAGHPPGSPRCALMAFPS